MTARREAFEVNTLNSCNEREEEWGEDGENVKDGRELVVSWPPGRECRQCTSSMS